MRSWLESYYKAYKYENLKKFTKHVSFKRFLCNKNIKCLKKLIIFKL